MTITKKRLLSAFLVLCMLCPMLPTTVFAEGESVTISTNYVDVTGDDYKDLTALTITDTDVISLKINAKKGSSAADLTITIPEGLSLYAAPGYGSGSSVDSSMFSSDPTWTPTTNLSKTCTDAGAVTSNAGTLTYPVTTSADSFTFYVDLIADPDLIQMSNDAVDDTLLGSVTASLTDSATATDSLAVSASTQAANLRFTSLTASEYLPTAISSVGEGDLMEGSSTVMSYSVVFTMDPAITGATCTTSTGNTGAYYTMRAYDLSLILTVPADATVSTSSSSYTSIQLGTGDTYYDSDDDTDQYKITVSSGATFNSNISLSGFAQVDFSDLAPEADDYYAVTVSGLEITVDQYVYDENGTSGFEERIFYVTNLLTHTTDVVGTPTTYAPTYNTSSGSTEMYNPGDTDANADDLYTLYSARRTISGSTTNATLNSWDPITLTYTATQVEDDTFTLAYLDTVSQVVMSVPFLSDNDDTDTDGTVDDSIPRHVAQLTSLIVRYEDAPTTDVKLTLTNYAINLDTAASNITNIQLDTSGIAVYNASYPAITFTAPEGKSLVYIAATFTGDNDTLYSSNLSTVYGEPKSEESTTNYSRYTFAVYVGDSSTATASVSGGFRWKATETFSLPITDTSLSYKNYLYNATKENTVSMGYPTDGDNNANLYGYQNLGSATLQNSSGTASEDDVTITITPDASNYDMVKEIYFPLYDGATIDNILSLSYTDSTGKTVSYEKGDASVPFTLAADDALAQAKIGENGLVSTFGIVCADGEPPSPLSPSHWTVGATAQPTPICNSVGISATAITLPKQMHTKSLSP